MRNLLPALIVGVIFGAGLVLSDMVNPARVQAFLDVAGAWDPTMMFVMGAALLPSALAYLVHRRMQQPLLADQFFIPRNGPIDRPLLIGAALFGIGWGMAGFCPGPAVAGLVLGIWQVWLFVAAMLVGMILHRFANARFSKMSASAA
ncbi:YeeE/YedE family protein [Alteripontixanthobacter muriae]|uniref:YeeE/YedE family protein n=1 Tax=Alteripontixanthobacter muriae TaxID=2705546 RepID=UPI0019D55BC8|nr:YeeE/YedE family protein [Alteripontixanthobacter muriae]